MRFLTVPYLLPLVLLSSCGEKNQNAVELEGLDDDSISVRLGMVSNNGVRMGGGGDQDGMGLLSGNSVSVKVAVSGCKSGYSNTIDTFTAIDQLKLKFFKNDTGCKIKLTAVRLKATGSSTSADYQMPSGTPESAYAFAGPSPSAQSKVYSATVGTTRKLLVKDALLDLKSNTTPDFRFQAIDGDVTTRSVKNVSQTQSLGSAALEAPNFEIPFDAKFPESANNGLGLSSMGAVYSAGAAGSAEANGGFQLDVLLRCANNVSLGTAGAVNTTAACPTPAGDQMKIHDLQIAAVMCRSTDDKLTFEQVAALFAAVPSARVMNSPTSLVPVIKSGATFNSTATADYITGLRFKGVKAHFPTAAITGTAISKGCAFDQSEAAKGWLILRKSEGTGSSAATSYLVTNLELSAASTTAMIATSMKEEIRIFNYTGALESFKVPNGVTSISIKAWGAGGCVFDETPNYAASHNAEFGGAGGYSAATVSVKAGETVYVEVGQGGRDVSAPGSYPNGGAGYNGGCDGGGSSNVYIDGYGKQDKLVLVAGGGGGAGWYTPSGSQKQGNGAAGGGLTAQNGGANAGSGGSQTVGGQTGNGKGAALQGGASSGNGGTGGPGGGGGGYFGGASGVGGFGTTNGGGGGGSCYVGPSATGGVLASNAGSTGIIDYVDQAGTFRKIGDRSFSAAECLSGTGKTPPKASDPDYSAGVAAGGAIADAKQIPGAAANWKSAVGGNGRVVIRYLAPVTQVANLSSATVFVDAEQATPVERISNVTLSMGGEASRDTATFAAGAASLSFMNGGYGKLNLPNGLGNGEWTIEGWFRVRAFNDTYQMMMSSFDVGAFAIGIYGGELVMGVNKPAGGNRNTEWHSPTWQPLTQTKIGAKPELNKWHHFALVFDGSAYMCFFDGKMRRLESSSDIVAPFKVINLGAGWGYWQTNNSYPSNINLDNIAVTVGRANYKAGNFTPAK